MDEHLGYERYGQSAESNYCNGTKSKPVFPSDDNLLKMLYLSVSCLARLAKPALLDMSGNRIIIQARAEP